PLDRSGTTTAEDTQVYGEDRAARRRDDSVEKTYSGAGSVHRDQGPLATVTDPGPRLPCKVCKTTAEAPQPMRQYEDPEEPSPTQKVCRGGETTAGDLTAAKAKGRSARGKVRDVLEAAWPVRRDEDAAVNDSEPAYKRQGVKTGGKARESTATAPPARQDGGRLGREGRTVTAKVSSDIY
ncbi:hypothetical protein CF319_g8941, partial [Tilletia indica]